MRAMLLLGMLALLAIPVMVSATTWVETKIVDPISGEKCVVQTPASSGSYIYQWPEKYDQVFWPLTDHNGVWFCRDSGFAAFIGDIELNAEEKAAIGDFLKKTMPLPKDPGMDVVLSRLEAIYALRKLEPDVETWVLRALAYQYQSSGAQAKASELRARAAATMETRLADVNLDRTLRWQYLFVTANYAREQGRDGESDAKLEQLSRLLDEAGNDERLNGYAEYLRALLATARKIAPGGVLAPEE